MVQKEREGKGAKLLEKEGEQDHREGERGGGGQGRSLQRHQSNAAGDEIQGGITAGVGK